MQSTPDLSRFGATTQKLLMDPRVIKWLKETTVSRCRLVRDP